MKILNSLAYNQIGTNNYDALGNLEQNTAVDWKSIFSQALENNIEIDTNLIDSSKVISLQQELLNYLVENSSNTDQDSSYNFFKDNIELLLPLVGSENCQILLNSLQSGHLNGNGSLAGNPILTDKPVKINYHNNYPQGKTNGSTSPGNVEKWTDEAIKIADVGEDWKPYLLWLAEHESSGDPSAVNKKPVKGEHATGLMQTLPSTFHSYCKKGYEDIYNPVDNSVAAINYIKSRYQHPGNIPNILQTPWKGY